MRKGVDHASSCTANVAARGRHRLDGAPDCPPLRSAVRSALDGQMSALCLSGVMSAGLLAGVAPAGAGTFPAVIELRSLYPGFGGDGSRGFVLNGIDEIDYAGRSVSGVRDVNGDGVDDVMISSSAADPHGEVGAGESYVVFGRTAGFEAMLPLASLLPAQGGDGSTGFVIHGADAYDLSGWSASGAGDVNGDGLDDMIIGAPWVDRGGRTHVGECYVVFGRTAGFPATFELRKLRARAGGDGSEGFILQGIAQSDNAGQVVSGAGDVNGDGIDDLLITAYLAGRSQQGQAYVVFGRTSGFPAEFPLRALLPMAGGDGNAGFVIQGIQPAGNMGRAVSGAGDVNGDGIDDVLIGAHNTQDNAGESYVVFGRTTGFPAFLPLRTLLPSQGGDGSEGFILRGADSFEFSGYSVSEAGDVNGDGVDDLVIGAKGDLGGAGAGYLVFGRTTGFPPVFELQNLQPAFGGDGSEGVVFAGRHNDDRAGVSVSGAGDTNGDGIDDLMISANGADPGARDRAGESYVVFGRRSGFPALFELQSLSPQSGGDGSEGFIVAGARAHDGSGASVSDAGDVNADGVGDVLIGATGVDPRGRTSAGASYVVFGRR